MKILVTGASGYLGNKLAHSLANKGQQVTALVRSPSANKFLSHPNIRIVRGDVLAKETITTAMKGCERVYHVAATVAPWIKDANDYYKVNVDGTRYVLDAAAQSGVQKIVFTSTCGVLGPSLNEPLSENDPRSTAFTTDYELSKKMAEDIVAQYARQGINIVTVCPAKIYGPGNVSHALTANAVIEKFLFKRRVVIPGPGSQKACFCFIDDVVNGHLLAMENGIPGEKYILGGINISYQEFFEEIRNLSGCRGQIIHASKNALRAWAVLQWLNYKATGAPPRFTLNALNIVWSNYIFNSEKACRELGYQITSLPEALHQTIHFLKTENHA